MGFRLTAERPDMLVLVREVKGGAVYRYRGYEFTIERSGVLWWCFQGIRIPVARYTGTGFSEFSMLGIEHETGWAACSRGTILRKLCRTIDRDIRQWIRDQGLDGDPMDARASASVGEA